MVTYLAPRYCTGAALESRSSPYFYNNPQSTFMLVGDFVVLWDYCKELPPVLTPNTAIGFSLGVKDTLFLIDTLSKNGKPLDDCFLYSLRLVSPVRIVQQLSDSAF